MKEEVCLWCGLLFPIMPGTFNRYCSLRCKWEAEHDGEYDA